MISEGSKLTRRVWHTPKPPQRWFGPAGRGQGRYFSVVSAGFTADGERTRAPTVTAGPPPEHFLGLAKVRFPARDLGSGECKASIRSADRAGGDAVLRFGPCHGLADGRQHSHAAGAADWRSQRQALIDRAGAERGRRRERRRWCCEGATRVGRNGISASSNRFFKFLRHKPRRLQIRHATRIGTQPFERQSRRRCACCRAQF